MPKVSIVVPVYNVEKYLNQCLESLINQTLKDIEIVCVDDYSTDNSLKILQEYAKGDSRIKIIKNSFPKGRNWGGTRNLALDNATGEYIMFLDSDDWYELDACEKAYNHVSNNDNDFAYFNFKFFYEDTGVFNIDDTRLNCLSEFSSEGGESNNFSFREIKTPKSLSYGECWYKIYSNKFLKKHNIRFPEYKMMEDIPFYIQVITCAESISILDEPLYIYRQRANSSLRNPDDIMDLFETREMAYKTILATKNQLLIKYYPATYINSLLGFYKRYRKTKIKKQYFHKMKECFLYFNQNHNINELKEYIKYKEYRKVLKYNYFIFSCIELSGELSKFIFSIKNDKKNGKKRKIITFFGIKIPLS